MIFKSFNNEDEETDFGGHHFDSFYLFFRLGETEVEEPVAWRRLERERRVNQWNRRRCQGEQSGETWQRVGITQIEVKGKG